MNSFFTRFKKLINSDGESDKEDNYTHQDKEEIEEEEEQLENAEHSDHSEHEPKVEDDRFYDERSFHSENDEKQKEKRGEERNQVDQFQELLHRPRHVIEEEKSYFDNLKEVSNVGYSNKEKHKEKEEDIYLECYSDSDSFQSDNRNQDNKGDGEFKREKGTDFTIQINGSDKSNEKIRMEQSSKDPGEIQIERQKQERVRELRVLREFLHPVKNMKEEGHIAKIERLFCQDGDSQERKKTKRGIEGKQIGKLKHMFEPACDKSKDNKGALTETRQFLDVDLKVKSNNDSSDTYRSDVKIHHLSYREEPEEELKTGVEIQQQCVMDKSSSREKLLQEATEESHLNKFKSVFYTEEPIEKEEIVSKKSCCCAALVEPALFLTGMGYASFSPLNQEYLYYRILADLSNDFLEAFPNYPNASKLPPSVYSEASSEAALFSAKMALVRCIPPIFIALIICSATDYYGRKIGMILPTIGALGRGIVYLLVILFELPLDCLYLGEFIDGICGSHLVMLSACYAFITDTADPKTLVVRFLVGMCMYLTSAGVGNFVLGQLIVYLGFAFAIAFILACYGSAFLYIACILPESKPPKAEGKKDFSVVETIKQFANSVQVIIRPRENPIDRTVLLLLLLCSLFCSIALQGVFDQQTVYMLGAPFYLTPDVVGIILGVCGLCWGIIPPIYMTTMRKFLSNEISLLTITATGMICYVIQGICVTPQQLLTVYIISSFGIGAAQVNNALMTLVADTSETGAIQAVNASVSSIGELLSKTLLVTIYAVTAEYYHGISHFFCAFLLGMCSIVYLCVWRLRKRSSTEPDTIQKTEIRDIL